MSMGLRWFGVIWMIVVLALFGAFTIAVGSRAGRDSAPS